MFQWPAKLGLLPWITVLLRRYGFSLRCPIGQSKGAPRWHFFEAGHHARRPGRSLDSTLSTHDGPANRRCQSIWRVPDRKHHSFNGGLWTAASQRRKASMEIISSSPVSVAPGQPETTWTSWNRWDIRRRYTTCLSLRWEDAEPSCQSWIMWVKYILLKAQYWDRSCVTNAGFAGCAAHRFLLFLNSNTDTCIS